MFFTTFMENRNTFGYTEYFTNILKCIESNEMYKRVIMIPWVLKMDQVITINLSALTHITQIRRDFDAREFAAISQR